MLNSLRNLGRTILGKILMVFLIVGVAGYGISAVIFDLGSNTVARVGDKDITSREFQRAYNMQLNTVAQQIGRVPTPAEAEAMGIPTSVLLRLGNDAAVSRLASTYGLGISDQRLDEMGRADPSFFGAAGRFDPITYQRVLQQNGYTEAEYEALQRNASTRQQIVAAVFADMALPKAAERLVARFTGDTRTVDYFVINELALPSPPAPTEEELAAYLEANKARFRTSETRAVDVLALSPDLLAAGTEVSDEDIAAEYERTRASRMAPERRTMMQVPLNATTLPVFEAGLAAGRSFDELVAETGVTPVQLGTLARSQVVDARLASEAFTLTAGTFSIIPGVGGRRAVYVSAIEGGGQIPLEAVRDQIRQELAMSRARTRHVDVLDQIEELRAAFRPLPEIAERFNLTLSSLDVTSAGDALAAVPGLAAGSRAQVAGAIFAATEGRLPSTVTLGANSHVWFELKGVTPARDQTLDEVREAVTEAWTAEKTAEALEAEVERLTGALDAGTPFMDLAAVSNLLPSISQAMTRNGDGGVIDGAVAAAVFAGGLGHAGAARNSDGEYVVFQVVEVNPAAGEPPAQTRDFLAQSGQDTLYADFITGLREATGLSVNQQVLQNLLAAQTASGG